MIFSVYNLVRNGGAGAMLTRKIENKIKEWIHNSNAGFCDRAQRKDFAD